MFLVEVWSLPNHAVVGLLIVFYGEVDFDILLYVLLSTEMNKRLEPSL